MKKRGSNLLAQQTKPARGKCDEEFKQQALMMVRNGQEGALSRRGSFCYNFATKQVSRRRRLFSFMHYSQGGNLVWIQLFAIYGTLFKMP